MINPLWHVSAWIRLPLHWLMCLFQLLIHWILNKAGTILQTSFSDAFSLVKNFTHKSALVEVLAWHQTDNKPLGPPRHSCWALQFSCVQSTTAGQFAPCQILLYHLGTITVQQHWHLPMWTCPSDTYILADTFTPQSLDWFTQSQVLWNHLGVDGDSWRC